MHRTRNQYRDKLASQIPGNAEDSFAAKVEPSRATVAQVKKSSFNSSYLLCTVQRAAARRDLTPQNPDSAPRTLI